MENKQDKGFTLVELLIVIVILGILATVTVFAVRGITDRGQENACDVELRTVQTAIEAYYADNQEDPGDINDLVGRYLRDDPTDGANATMAIDFTASPVTVSGVGNCAAPTTT
jgi:general secretion pathway protein G